MSGHAFSKWDGEPRDGGTVLRGPCHHPLGPAVATEESKQTASKRLVPKRNTSYSRIWHVRLVRAGVLQFDLE